MQPFFHFLSDENNKRFFFIWGRNVTQCRRPKGTFLYQVKKVPSCLFICLSICPTTKPTIRLSTHVCLSFCRSIATSLFVYPNVCLSFYRSMASVIVHFPSHTQCKLVQTCFCHSNDVSMLQTNRNCLSLNWRWILNTKFSIVRQHVWM